jgi:hypothetical protein
LDGTSVPENWPKKKLSPDNRNLFINRMVARSNGDEFPETSSVKIYSKETIERTTGRFCCNRRGRKVLRMGGKDENLYRTSGCNNRSLALRKTFGRFKSEWEPSSRIVPIRVSKWVRKFGRCFIRTSPLLGEVQNKMLIRD